MSAEKLGTKNGQDRRKSKDRRKVERRKVERSEKNGVLTTRTGEDRRQHHRRTEDRQSEE